MISSLRREVGVFKPSPPGGSEKPLPIARGSDPFVGRSSSFLKATSHLQLIARTDEVVLIVGETGTGKELCAKALHRLSGRSDRRFVPVNCASFPNDLFENELFGHARGAYTDAATSQRGLIAEAEGGSLFLDEINSLPMSTQVKLLRFLEDKSYRPLGSPNAITTSKSLLSRAQAIEDHVL